MELVFEVIAAHRLQRGDIRSPAFGESGGTIGRHPDCDWSIEDRSRLLSGRHARIAWRNGRFFLTDISRNGIERAGGEWLVKGEGIEIEDGAGFRFGELDLIAHLYGVNIDAAKCSSPPWARDALPDAAFDRALDPLRILEEQGSDYAVFDELTGWLGDPTTLRPLADDSSADRDHLLIPRLVPERRPDTAQPVDPSGSPERLWRQLSEALGVDVHGMTTEERETLLLSAVRLLGQCVDGLQRALRNRDDLQGDIGVATRQEAAGTRLALDPSLSAMDALRELLLDTSLPALRERCLPETFRQLQLHEVALVAGSRAAVRAALAQFSPEQLNWAFERDSSRSVINTAGSRWRAYLRFHHAVSRSDDWCDDLFARHFADAYRDQLRLTHTLHLDFQG
jgi:type VI secretion system protein ImpI